MLSFLKRDVAAVPKPSVSILGSDGDQCLRDRFFKHFSRSGSCPPQERLNLRERRPEWERNWENKQAERAGDIRDPQ